MVTITCHPNRYEVREEAGPVVAVGLTMEAATAARRLLSGECLRGLDPTLQRRNALEEARKEGRWR